MAATRETALSAINDARATLIGDWGDYAEEDYDAQQREASAMLRVAHAMMAYLSRDWKLAVEKAEEAIKVHGGN